MSADDEESPEPEVVHPEEVDRNFDWRGWSLVAAIFVAFLVIPGAIYLYPHAPSVVGLSFWDTYLVLPMIPAIVLGLLAVWATTRP
jgi:ABC-type glycerol-3-phosphate transport system permease component